MKKKAKNRKLTGKSRSAKRGSRKISAAPRKTTSSGYKTYYGVSSNYAYFNELQDLVLKSSPAEIGQMTQNISKLGRVKLAIISGIFLNRENTESITADLLIVADDLNPQRLRRFLKSLEAEVGKTVRFVIMESEEFKYRMAMFDRFTRVMMEGPHEKLINKLGI